MLQNTFLHLTKEPVCNPAIELFTALTLCAPVDPFLRPWPEILHRKYDNFCAKSDAIVEVDHIIVDQTNAATRGPLANAGRVIGAVNAIFGAADIYRTRAEWIAGATRNHARQIGLATDHLRRWVPIRPLGFTRNTFY